MILYFSGTGNSLAVAKQIAGEDAPLTDLGACLKEGRQTLPVGDGETLCVVLPVYFGGLPEAAEEYLRTVAFSRKPGWVCGVLTHSGCPLDADLAFAGAVKSNPSLGMPPDAVYTVLMPDNLVLLSPLQDEERIARCLKAAEAETEGIRKKILDRVPERPWEGRAPVLPEVSASFRAAYDDLRRTEAFHVADTCVHCGVCASRCPCGALIMREGTPTWVKERCTLCMACVRCGAILYGDRITGKPRYVHPALRKKKTRSPS